MLNLFFVLCLGSYLTVDSLVKSSYFSFVSQERKIRVVHFKTSNCYLCDKVEKIYNELSRMYKQDDRLVFGIYDCDKEKDICESGGVNDYPYWKVFFPSEHLGKRYNRNYDVNSFVKYIRQRTGISPYSNENNLIYYNYNELRNLTSKSRCILAIVDEPKMNLSQNLHKTLRYIEMIIKSGVRFVAFNKKDDLTLEQKLGKNEYGAFLILKNKWISYKGSETDHNEVEKFLKSNNCQYILNPKSQIKNEDEEEYVDDVTDTSPIQYDTKEEFIPLEDDVETEDNDGDVDFTLDKEVEWISDDIDDVDL